MTSRRLSISRSSWLEDALVDVRAEAVLGAESSAGAMASMVSKNRRQGAARRAFLKTSRSAFSDSPSHFEKSCGPSTAMSGNLLLARQRPRHRRLSGARRPDEAGCRAAASARPARRARRACAHARRSRRAAASPRRARRATRNVERALLDEEFARRARLDLLQPGEEVVARHLQRAELGRLPASPAAARACVDERNRRSAIMPTSWHSASRSAPTKPCECSAISCEVDVGRERHGARVDLEDLQPAWRVRHADLDLAIEAARPSQRRIEHLGDVGGADDDHLAARDEAVHQAEQLRDDALLDLADDLGALGRDGVDLVDEEDRRRAARRLLEDLAELAPRSRRRTSA